MAAVEIDSPFALRGSEPSFIEKRFSHGCRIGTVQQRSESGFEHRRHFHGVRMERKIDWVSLNPRTARKRVVDADETAEDFHRDVGTLGTQAQRNHVKLAEYARQLDALRRGEA